MKSNMFKASLTLLATVLCMSSCVSATGTTHTVSSTDLDPAALQKFKDCVAKIGVNFIFAVDGDQLIVLPPLGNTTLSSDNEAKMHDCIASVSSSINIAYEDGHDSLHEYTGPYTHKDLECEGLRAAGVAGLELIPKNAAPNATATKRSMSKRANTAYFYSLGAEDNNCVHYDQEINVYSECISKSNSYASISFGNVNTIYQLRVSFWPHHQCAVDYKKKNTRTIYVPPAADSTCQKKTTFSWYGTKYSCGSILC